MKHSRDFEPGESRELDDYLPGQRPPIEAQLIDLCDEIAYNTADLDDAFGAGMIRAEDAQAQVGKFAELWEAAEGHFPAASQRVRMKEVIRGLIDHLASGLMEGTSAAASGLPDIAAVRASTRAAQFTESAAECSRELKSLLRDKVYDAAVLVEARSESVALVAKLFGWFLENPDRLPEEYREEFSSEPVHRQVCDYIAGMTDGFFLRTCAQVRSGAGWQPARDW